MAYLEILENLHDDMLKTLEEIIAYPSVVSQAVRTADGELLPFGRPVHDAYTYLLMLGDRLGFSTHNANNYGGHIELKATSQDAKAGKTENFGILAHVDVVPGGEGWTGDAFKLEQRDGFLYGRGVSDDKGPLIACLYAMKAVKDSGAEIKKNIRLIIGLDEETGMRGMRYYIDRVGCPDMGFTPDADFPLINGEKGILIFDLAQKLSRQPQNDGLRLTKLTAGTAPNAVPASAKAVVTGDAAHYDTIRDRIAGFNAETGYTVRGKKQGNAYVIEAAGIAAHGAEPEKGLNAISVLMAFLGRLSFGNEEINEFIAFYNDCIGCNLHGEKMNCEFSDTQSGKLIFNVGMASINEEIAQLTVNIRYPVTCTAEDVYTGIEKSLEGRSIGIVKTMEEGPVFLDTDSPLVEKLLGAYREVTGDYDTPPQVIGGGTYAKTAPGTLAFGALFPGEESTMHQADERVSIESFFKMTEIYARAIYSICCE